MSAGRKEEQLEGAEERPKSGEWDLERGRELLYSHSSKQTQDPGALAVSRTALITGADASLSVLLTEPYCCCQLPLVAQRHGTASSRLNATNCQTQDQ